MSHREGNNRAEPIKLFLEEEIAPDNPVRLIDAYVDSLNLEELGFSHVVASETGSPPYPPGALLKLYIYGYLNRLRSSRQLAWGCEVNIELWWLLGGLRPSYRTIARFRSDQPKAFRKVFEHYAQSLKGWGLLEGKTVGVDSVKLRAQNSKKNHYSAEKLKRGQERIKGNIERYLKEVDQADEEGGEEGLAHKQQAQAKATEQIERLSKYQSLQAQLEKSTDKQLCTTDTDARALALGGNRIAVGYSAQVATAAEHKLLVYYQATNQNDTHALHKVAQGAKQALGIEKLDILADKGYHTGNELAACAEDGMTTYVAPLAAKRPANGTQPGFWASDFTYVEEEDYYICPQGYDLHTNGYYHEKGTYRVKQYKTPACEGCPVRQQCTQSKTGRMIQRSEYQGYIDANRKRVEDRKEYYRQRQAIVEHPFGTIKRGWGYTYTLLRGMEKVDGELGLIFFCYNLRRTMSILGVQQAIEHLRGLLIAFWCSVAPWKARPGNQIFPLIARHGPLCFAKAGKEEASMTFGTL